MPREQNEQQVPISPLQLTERAVEMAKSIMEREGVVGHGLRIGVVGGGCSGLRYEMDFQPSPNPGDLVIDLDGLRVFVSEANRPQLDGITVDYVSSLQGAGFKFVNPRAARTCGCGESFAT